MKFIKSDNLSFLYRVFGWRGAERLSAAVLAGFDLNEPSRLLPESEMWDRASSALKPFQILDFSMPKPCGEVMVVGKCFPQGKIQALGANAFFSLGALERRVEVFGARFVKPGFLGYEPVKPQPFSEMDISWENAFGGPEYNQNPVGKGIDPVYTVNGDKLIPLPNIENPNHLVVSQDDRPAPAGFGPLGIDWPVRLKKRGSFDKKWLVDQWPRLPDDFDFQYYLLAPEEQRINGFFKGDEFFQIRGMHPEKSSMHGKLPSLGCRLFQQNVDSSQDEINEVPTKLDTVYFFPHLDMGLLIWRGLTETADDEAEDVEFLAAFTEPLSQEPKPVDYYVQQLLSPVLLDEPIPEPIDEPDLEDEEEEAGDAAPLAAPDPEIAAAADQLSASIDENESFLKQSLAAAGVDPVESMPVPDLKEAAPPRDPAEWLKQTKKSAAEAEESLNKLLTESGVDRPVPQMPEFKNADQALAFFAAIGLKEPEFVKDIRSLYEERQAVGEALAALKPEPEEGEELEEPQVEAAAPEDEPEVLTRESIISGHAAGESFFRADLTGVDLSGCLLTGIDLREAVLEDVNFMEADLGRALMDGAVLTKVNLAKANLAEAVLTNVVASGAVVAGADLTGARISGSDFTESDLSGACLVGADMSDSLFDKADLTKADLSNTVAQRASFEQASCEKTCFHKADLSVARFNKAQLGGADFSEIQAKNMQLHGAICDKAVLKNADLSSSRAGDNASFKSCDLTNACLRGACWEAVDLSDSDLSQAEIDKAQLSRSKFVGAVLFACNGRNTDFSKCDFTTAQMPAINLMGSRLRKARLTNADLRGANLFGTDLYKAVIGNTDLTGANINRTLLKLGEGGL